VSLASEPDEQKNALPKLDPSAAGGAMLIRCSARSMAGPTVLPAKL
jgi:hypothetical protein